MENFGTIKDTFNNILAESIIKKMIVVKSYLANILNYLQKIKH